MPGFVSLRSSEPMPSPVGPGRPGRALSRRSATDLAHRDRARSELQTSGRLPWGGRFAGFQAFTFGRPPAAASRRRAALPSFARRPSPELRAENPTVELVTPYDQDRLSMLQRQRWRQRSREQPSPVLRGICQPAGLGLSRANGDGLQRRWKVTWLRHTVRTVSGSDAQPHDGLEHRDRYRWVLHRLDVHRFRLSICAALPAIRPNSADEVLSS